VPTFSPFPRRSTTLLCFVQDPPGEYTFFPFLLSFFPDFSRNNTSRLPHPCLVPPPPSARLDKALPGRVLHSTSRFDFSCFLSFFSLAVRRDYSFSLGIYFPSRVALGIWLWVIFFAQTRWTSMGVYFPFPPFGCWRVFSLPRPLALFWPGHDGKGLPESGCTVFVSQMAFFFFFGRSLKFSRPPGFFPSHPFCPPQAGPQTVDGFSAVPRFFVCFKEWL